MVVITIFVIELLIILVVILVVDSVPVLIAVTAIKEIFNKS